MKIFKLALLTLTSAFALTAFSPLASALPISNFTDTVGTGATQLGRLSRNGTTPQDWNGSETFPGVINTGTTYYYHTYTFASSLFTGAPYIDISVFDQLNASNPATGANFFVSAYKNSYDPTNLVTNWLGDVAASGNFFNVNARYFDVVLPMGSSLVLVVNSTGAGTAGTASPYDISINAFGGSSFEDPIPAAVPEPSTLVTLGTGLAGLVAVVRRRAATRA